MNNNTIQSGYECYDHQTDHSDEEYSSHSSHGHDLTRSHNKVKSIIQKIAGYDTSTQSQYHIFDDKIIRADADKYEKDTTDYENDDTEPKEEFKTEYMRSTPFQIDEKEMHKGQVYKNDEFLQKSIEKELKELLAKQERAYEEMDSENNLDKYLQNQLQEYFLSILNN